MLEEVFVCVPECDLGELRAGRIDECLVHPGGISTVKSGESLAHHVIDL